MQRACIVEGLTTTDEVFETLLGHIVSGKRAAGSRLPGERELSRRLGASRTTLREALRRLEAWNVVRTQRGVGISIRPYRDWSVEVLSTYLRLGRPLADQATLDLVLGDTLAMRRAIIIEILRIATSRVPPNGMRSARLAAARAWSLRDEATYARAELQILREIVSAGSFTPGLWLLNRMTDAALSPLWLAPGPPDDYVGIYAKFFDLIEAGAFEQAIQLMREYLERRDELYLEELRHRLVSEAPKRAEAGR
jgi:DNA-binding FadR family transcriptional regulator